MSDSLGTGLTGFPWWRGPHVGSLLDLIPMGTVYASGLHELPSRDLWQVPSPNPGALLVLYLPAKPGGVCVFVCSLLLWTPETVGNFNNWIAFSLGVKSSSIKILTIWSWYNQGVTVWAFQSCYSCLFFCSEHAVTDWKPTVLYRHLCFLLRILIISICILSLWTLISYHQFHHYFSIFPMYL